MKQFTNQNSATVNRMAYANGISTFSTVGTANGYLMPLDAEAAAQNGFQYGYAFKFIMELGQNVLIGDQLVIGSTTYMVRGLMNKGGGFVATNYMYAIVTVAE